jgi:hypothetical protein
MTVPEATDREALRRKRRPYLWTAGAILLSLSLVAVAWWVDRGRESDARPGRTRRGPVADLVAPSPLSDRERSGTGPAFGSQESVRLEQGAWIQVADAKGNLKQQYTATRIDPLPDKRVAMQQPRAVLYSDGGRIITMRSDAMTARIPRRALESGKLDGNVVIRIYRSVGGRPVDLAKDAPDVVVESPEAQFDAASGEIRCDRRVRITGNALDFDGEGLSLSLAPDGKTIDRLVVDRALAPVRFNRSVAAAQDAERRKLRAEAVKAAPTAPAAPSVPPAASGAPPAAVRAARRPASEASRLFLLTLHDDVDVVSIEAGRRTEVTADRLDAYFMLGGGVAKGLAVGDPFGPAPERGGAEVTGIAHGPLPAQVLGAAFAALADDVVEVRFAGRLVMAPAPEGTPELSDPSAVRVVVSGAPARITDSRSEAVITAQRATFESGAERVELLGDAKVPAAVTSPRFGLSAQRFQLDRSTGIGSSEGPGSITVGGAGAKPLTVAWARSMRVALAPAKGGDMEGSLRAAEFDGEVRASSKDFELEAGHLAIESQPAGKKDCPRRIEATGGVRAKALGRTGGKFAAQRVEVTLSPDAAGDAQARNLVATGDVMAADAAQTMWASALRLTFVDRPKARGAGAGSRPDEAMAADVGAVVAEGPVELRMQDGTRVWAARLEGDGRQRTARLVGPDLLVVRANLVLDQLNEISVQDSPARLSSVGPGRASGFKDRVVPDSDARLGRPQVKGVPQMQATWRDSLAFADQAVKPREGGAARGLLLLQGTVKVRASRDAREAEAMDADEIQVEFLPNGAKVAAAPKGKQGGGADAAVQRIGTMRAVGNVRLEARQWVDGRREGQPKLFRMTAPSVAYDGATGGIAVDGAGSLLVFDPGKPRTRAQADEAKSPFSPDGTTRFTWKRSLAVERRQDGTSRVVLERDVVMEHLGASDAATGTVTADRMTAVVRGVEGVEPARAGDMGASLGGPAELVSVFADGRVVVRTADIDVDGGEFELDVKRQIGAIRAPVGRLVTVVRHGTPAPARAHAFTWDLVKGSFAVEGARGTVGR